jgi:hypothetical protein
MMDVTLVHEESNYDVFIHETTKWSLKNRASNES